MITPKCGSYLYFPEFLPALAHFVKTLFRTNYSKMLTKILFQNISKKIGIKKLKSFIFCFLYCSTSGRHFCFFCHKRWASDTSVAYDCWASCRCTKLLSKIPPITRPANMKSLWVLGKFLGFGFKKMYVRFHMNHPNETWKSQLKVKILEVSQTLLGVNKK